MSFKWEICREKERYRISQFCASMADHSHDLDQLLDSKLTTLYVCVGVCENCELNNFESLYRCVG